MTAQKVMTKRKQVVIVLRLLVRRLAVVTGLRLVQGDPE